DFFEGVRAHIIDKDKTPNWAPEPSAAQDKTPKWAPEPSAAQVAAFFEELPEEQRLRLPYLEEWQPLDDDLQRPRLPYLERWEPLDDDLQKPDPPPYLVAWDPLDDKLQVKRVAAAKRKKAEDKIEALKLGSRDGRRMSKR
ncbi:hypothetical protein T484DRAFT_1764027, partial [Baffinella frigidus]